MRENKIVLKEIIDVEGDSKFDKPMFTKTGPTILPAELEVMVSPRAALIRTRLLSIKHGGALKGKERKK
jgi:hypothetical protein